MTADYACALLCAVEEASHLRYSRSGTPCMPRLCLSTFARNLCPPSSTSSEPRSSSTKVGGLGFSCVAHLMRPSRLAVPPVPKKRSACLARLSRSLYAETLWGRCDEEKEEEDKKRCIKLVRTASMSDVRYKIQTANVFLHMHVQCTRTTEHQAVSVCKAECQYATITADRLEQSSHLGGHCCTVDHTDNTVFAQHGCMLTSQPLRCR